MAKNSEDATMSHEAADGAGRCSANHVVGKWLTRSKTQAPQADAEVATNAFTAQGRPLELAEFAAHGTPLQQCTQTLNYVAELMMEERRQLSDWMLRMEKQQASAKEELLQAWRSQREDFTVLLQRGFEHHQEWMSQERQTAEVPVQVRGRASMVKYARTATSFVSEVDTPDTDRRDTPGTDRRSRDTPDTDRRSLNSMDDSYEERTSRPARDAYEAEKSKMAEDVESMELASSQMFISIDTFARLLGYEQKAIDAMKQKPKNFMTRHVDSGSFKSAVMITILLNGIWIGYSTQSAMSTFMETGTYEESILSSWVTRIFAILFTLELMVSWYAYRLYFFTCRDWKWNVFDMLVVLASLIDFWISTTNFQYLRSVRLLRLVRAARIFRLFKASQGARVMFTTWLSALSEGLFTWSLGFLLFLTYLFAVFIMQLVIWLAEEPSKLDMDTRQWQQLDKYYGSLQATMRTLIQAVTFGQPWDYFLAPLKDVHWILEPAFTAWVVITILSTMNLISGIFHDSATEAKSRDRELSVSSYMADFIAFGNELRDLYCELGGGADEDNVKLMNWETFQGMLTHPEVRMFLGSRGIDVEAAAHLFQILREHGRVKKSLVHVEDFVVGCQRLTGAAKQMDLSIIHDIVEQNQKDTVVIQDRIRQTDYYIEQIMKDVTWLATCIATAGGRPAVGESPSRSWDI